MDDNRKHQDTDFSEDDMRLLYALGEATGDLPSAGETQSAWAAFEAKHRTDIRRRRSRKAAIWALAAAAAVAIVVLVMPWQRLRDVKEGFETFTAMDVPQHVEQTMKGGNTVISTPAATTLQAVLPDGTRVLLGASSRIEYPRSFDGLQTREVKLTGKARFEVKHDAAKPFTVHADGLDARVLGTVFDVSTYPGTHGSVTLYSGKVQVSAGNGDRSETLKPGQRAMLDGRQGLKVTSVDTQAAAGWSNGMFSFDDARLEDVMAEIGAWYNVSVSFLSRRPLDVRVHFNIPRTVTLQQAVEALNDMGIAAFRYDGKRISVSDKK